MILSLYKSGQGYWTRMLSAIGAGMISLCFVAWLVPHFNSWIDNEHTRLITQASVATGFLVVMSLVLFVVLNKPRVVDFMIATEAEMRKVNWPSKHEIIGSTWVVICGTFLMALFLFLVNTSSVYVFKLIGILPSAL